MDKWVKDTNRMFKRQEAWGLISIWEYGKPHNN